MIRFSSQNDINDIITLWKEAFGDSEEDIMFFINKKYKPENTIVYESDGQIASMFFLLEGEMRIQNKCYPSYYLYAACTLEKYRGKGLMASLLEFAEKTARSRGYYYICLLPASDSLYSYYKNFGYKTLFKKKIFKCSADTFNTKNIPSDSESCSLYSLRNKAFQDIDMFVWDNRSLEFAFEHHKYYGGQAVLNCNGYLLYSEESLNVFVKEFCFTDISSAYFPNSNDFKQIIFNLPVDYYTESDDYEIVDSGMILSLNDDAEELTKKMKNPYLGLTLD